MIHYFEEQEEEKSERERRSRQEPADMTSLYTVSTELVRIMRNAATNTIRTDVIAADKSPPSRLSCIQQVQPQLLIVKGWRRCR